MSYQLLEEMDGWEEDTDRLLVMLPIAGTVFRKTWFNPIKGKNDSEIVTADKLVVNYWAKPLDACPRVTQVCEYYPHEVLERFRSGAWREFNIGISPAADNDDDAKHEFLEQHRLWDLDEDGYPEPYVCTVHKETGKVVRVVARFDEDGVSLDAAGEVVCIAPVQYFTKYGFIPAMDGGFYDIGFGQLLDAINDTINTTFNQLMDAGSLQNAGGGFIGGNVVKGGSVTFRLGEWKRIDASGADLKNAIVPMPAHGPSAVLFNLLGLLVEAAKDITATKDILTGETGGTANVPVGTTLAMIEQGLKTFTAIFKRVHRSLKQELKALARLNSLYLEDEAYYTYQDQEGVIARQDYAAGDCDVVPVSDPTVVTDMQKVGQAQALLSFLGKGLDDSEIIRRALEAFSIQDIEGLMPKGPQPPPPEVLEMQAKLKLEEGKLALKADDNEIKRQGQVLAAAQAEADIDLKAAQAAKTAIEAMLLGPQFQAQLQQMIVDATMQAAGHDQVDRHKAADAALQARGQDMTAQAKAAQAQGMADGQVQPGIASGMEGLGPDQAVPGLPQGPPVGPGPAMGAGGELGVGYAGQGGAPGGDGQP
jgi:chaperonin GroES